MVTRKYSIACCAVDKRVEKELPINRSRLWGTNWCGASTK